MTEFLLTPSGLIVYQCQKPKCGSMFPAQDMNEARIHKSLHQVLEHSPVKNMKFGEERLLAIKKAMKQARSRASSRGLE